MGADRLMQTPSQTVGPFFAYGLAPEQYGYGWRSVAGPDLADETAEGRRIVIEGQVLDGAGAPIADALLEIRQADAAGRHAGQPGANTRFAGFGRCGTGTLPDGMFRFRTIMPGVAAPGEAPHIDVILTMRGLLLHVFTRIYFEGDPANATDPVLAQIPPERRATLLAKPSGEGVWRFDIRMQGEAETVFLDI